MPERPESFFELDAEYYAQAQARLRQLKSRLSERSVRNLAQEVIRLLAGEAKGDALQSPGATWIETLCHALISEDDQAGARMIQAARSEGATIEAVYLNYLAGAARMLGTWWEEDRVSFVEVTVGTSRMYAIMRALRRQMPIASHIRRKSAVFAAVPGETHVLGVRMATDLLRKEGWDIDLKIGKTHEELVQEIAESDMVIIGLSASSDQSVEALSRLIIALRIASPHLAIFVGGNIVEDQGETVELMDIDGMAADFDTAKQLLDGYVSRAAPLS